MGLRIKKYDGGYRSNWYAYYNDNNIKKEIKLDVKIAGVPPPSLSVKDRGDAAFERSRDRAQAKFDDFLTSVRQKGAAEGMLEKLIASKTGASLTYYRLDKLGELWNSAGRPRELSEGRQAENLFVAAEFASFCKKTYLYEVTDNDVERYFKWIKGRLAWSTVLGHMGFLSGAFNRFLPSGSHNPFKTIVKRNSDKNAATIHHAPLTDDEMRKVFATAKESDDEFMYPLVVAAVCTGARLKDLANLQWINIDFKEGMVDFNAAKTGSRCEIPLFPEFRKVCEELRAKRNPGEIYVFPDAANMYKYNRSGLVRRGKLLFAKALFYNDAVNTPSIEVIDDSSIKPQTPIDVLKQIDTMPCSNQVREKAKELYGRYAVQLQSFRQIERETGMSRSTISDIFKKVERFTGKSIVRFDKPAPTPRAFLSKTRVSRIGKKSVSIYGWHSFRTTFCVQAILHKVPDWMIIKAVGHATFKTTNEFYNNPKRESIKEVWMRAMASTAIGSTQPNLLQDTIDIKEAVEESA